MPTLVPFAQMDHSYLLQAEADTAALTDAQLINAGAIVDTKVFEAQQTRLSDLLSQYPDLDNPVNEYLKSTPNDDSAADELNASLEGLMANSIINSFVQALNMMKTTRQGFKVKDVNIKKRYEFAATDLANIEIGNKSTATSLDLSTEG